MGFSAEPLILLAALAVGGGALASDWDGPSRHDQDLPPSVHAVGPDARIVPDRRMHIEGEIHGMPVTFLVDTGAAVTILSRRDAHALGLATGSTPVLVRGVGGQSEARRVQIPELKIGSQRIGRIDALVVDDLETSLLGMDALAELGGVRIGSGAQGTIRPGDGVRGSPAGR